MDEKAEGAQKSAAPSSKKLKRRQRTVFDVITVFVLSITAVLTAWCGFQASKWGGEMSIAFSQASSARVQAAAAEGEARDARQFDLTIYTQWVLAQADGRSDLADYVEQRFTPEFAVAFAAWRADGMVEGGPFARDEYVPPGSERAAQFTERADEKFQEALQNNQRGDDYSLLTVLFALVLFLTAMSQRELAAWIRRTFLALAIAIAVGGAIVMLTFPIRI